MFTRVLIVLTAIAGAAAGVLWLKGETPHIGAAEATWEAPLVEARSLKPPQGKASVALTEARNVQSPLTTGRSQGGGHGDNDLTLPSGKTPLVLVAAQRAPGMSAVFEPRTVQGPPALKHWPREAVVRGTPEVETIAAPDPAGRFVYRTEHFEFSCDMALGADVVRHFARAFEATHLLNCLLPLDLKPAPEPMRRIFQARILSSDAAFEAAGAPAGSGGFYSRSNKCIFVPVSSLGVKVVGDRVTLDYSVESNATLIHEITHQMMNRWLPMLPTWLIEGSAVYVEMAEFMHGRFFLGQMQDRLKEHLRRRGARQMGSTVRYAMLNVAELLAMTSETWNAGLGTLASRENYASAMLLTHYLYHMDRGREGVGIIAMMRALENGMPKEQAVRQFILAGRQPAELEAEMGMAYARIGVELQFSRRGGEVFKP